MPLGFGRRGRDAMEIRQQAKRVGFDRAILARTGKFENAAGVIEQSIGVAGEQFCKAEIGARSGFAIGDLVGARKSQRPDQHRRSFGDASRQHPGIAQRRREDRDQIIDLTGAANLETMLEML